MTWKPKILDQEHTHYTITKVIADWLILQQSF